MRLLEFDPVEGGIDPQQPTQIAAQPAHIAAHPAGHPENAATRPHPVMQAARPANAAARVFPIKSSSTPLAAQRRPIDLESLQTRVDALEKRIRLRAHKNQTSPSAPELEQLKQRLLTLERNVNSELWAAKQREHTLLEMLARPPLITRIATRMERIRKHNLPAIGRWLKAASCEWLKDRQPDWWPQFARAWQESLDKARDF